MMLLQVPSDFQLIKFKAPWDPKELNGRALFLHGDASLPETAQAVKSAADAAAMSPPRVVVCHLPGEVY
jgi:hypothetical protein